MIFVFYSVSLSMYFYTIKNSRKKPYPIEFVRPYQTTLTKTFFSLSFEFKFFQRNENVISKRKNETKFILFNNFDSPFFFGCRFCPRPYILMMFIIIFVHVEFVECFLSFRLFAVNFLFPILAGSLTNKIKKNTISFESAVVFDDDNRDKK